MSEHDMRQLANRLLADAIEVAPFYDDRGWQNWQGVLITGNEAIVLAKLLRDHCDRHRLRYTETEGRKAGE